MTQSSDKSKTTNKTKTQGNQKTGQISLSKAEKDLRDEIVKEAKLLATQGTSSAFGIISKTRELLKIEDMLKS